MAKRVGWREWGVRENCIVGADAASVSGSKVSAWSVVWVGVSGPPSLLIALDLDSMNAGAADVEGDEERGLGGRYAG